MQHNLLLKTSMNSVTSIIVPDLFYNQRMIKAVVEKFVNEIHPIITYIKITHLTDEPVTLVSRVDIDSSQSVKKNEDVFNISKLRRLILMKFTHVIRIFYHQPRRIPPYLPCQRQLKLMIRLVQTPSLSRLAVR